jgi:hypothetical protein
MGPKLGGSYRIRSGAARNLIHIDEKRASRRSALAGQLTPFYLQQLRESKVNGGVACARDGSGGGVPVNPRLLCPNRMGVGVVPFDVSTFAKGLDCHLAHSNSVHAKHAVTVQRLICSDRLLQVAMMQRDIFSTLLFVGDRLHVLLVKLLRLDIEACFGEIECRLMAADHVVDLGVVCHA